MHLQFLEVWKSSKDTAIYTAQIVVWQVPENIHKSYITQIISHYTKRGKENFFGKIFLSQKH